MATAVMWTNRSTPRCNVSAPRALLPSSPPKLQPASANSDAASGKGGPGGAKKAANKSPRLTLAQKLEVVELLRQKTRHNVIAERYSCSERTVSNIASSKEGLKKRGAIASARDINAKTKMAMIHAHASRPARQTDI